LNDEATDQGTDCQAQQGWLRQHGTDLQAVYALGRATWLITGMEDGILYGYADLGMGCVEWGGIESLEGLEAVRGPFGLKVERDLYWTPKEGVEYNQLESLAGV